MGGAQEAPQGGGHGDARGVGAAARGCAGHGGGRRVARCCACLGWFSGLAMGEVMLRDLVDDLRLV